MDFLTSQPLPLQTSAPFSSLFTSVRLSFFHLASFHPVTPLPILHLSAGVPTYLGAFPPTAFLLVHLRPFPREHCASGSCRPISCWPDSLASGDTIVGRSGRAEPLPHPRSTLSRSHSFIALHLASQQSLPRGISPSVLHFMFQYPSQWTCLISPPLSKEASTARCYIATTSQLFLLDRTCPALRCRLARCKVSVRR